MSKPWGQPAIAVRMPAEMIAAAKIAARQEDTTVSDLVRDLLEQHLDSMGIDYKTVKQIDGQTHLDV